MDSDESLNEERLLEIIPNAIQTPPTTKESNATNNVHPVVAQQLKQPRCKSNIWIYFQRLDTTLAKCRICHNNYRFGSSISNLRHHAEAKHGDILRQGPVKFLEDLKVPKEHLKVVIHPERKQTQERRGFASWSHRKNKRRKKYMRANTDTLQFGNVDARVKDEYGHADTNSISFDESDMNKALESIYQNSEDVKTINNYMESQSSNDDDSATNAQFVKLDSYNNDYTLNGQASEIDEHEINISTEPMTHNPLTGQNNHRFQRLQEERMRAETNYFNKKAAYMERNADYVEAQRQHVMLQSKKLKMEIAAMKQTL